MTVADAQRQVEFEYFTEPFLPPDDQGDAFENDNEWAFRRRVSLGKELKPSRYSGYFVQSSTLGFVPLGEHNLPSRKRKLWTGHTNFRVNRHDEDAVCRVDGVSGYQTLGPYKFLVEVGWLFEDSAVRGNIRRALCPAPSVPVKQTGDVLERAAGLYAAWAIVRNGDKRDLVTGLTREEVEGKLATASQTAEKTSWAAK